MDRATSRAWSVVVGGGNIKGGIAEREGAIHASNVMLLCGECGKRTRIGHKLLADGTKTRICRHCEGALDK